MKSSSNTNNLVIACLSIVLLFFSPIRAEAEKSSTKKWIIIQFEDDKRWIDRILEKDETGVLVDLKITMKGWEKLKKYEEQWNLQSTGIYSTPSTDFQRDYITSSGFNFIDKTFNKEIKEIRNSKNGKSFTRKVATVSKVIQPKENVQVSENVKLQFSAKALRGEAKVAVVNPYLDADANTSITGSINIHVGKELKKLGFRVDSNYQVEGGRFIASVQKRITDNVTAVVSSSHDTQKFGFDGSNSSQELKVMYSISF